MRITETAGDTLKGAVDGSNTLFGTSYPIQFEYTAVYVNGLLKAASLDDGYTFPDNRTLQLKEAPFPQDTVAIEYRTGDLFGGGAPGGVPVALSLEGLRPQPAGAFGLSPGKPSLKRR